MFIKPVAQKSSDDVRKLHDNAVAALAAFKQQMTGLHDSFFGEPRVTAAIRAIEIAKDEADAKLKAHDSHSAQ